MNVTFSNFKYATLPVPLPVPLSFSLLYVIFSIPSPLINQTHYPTPPGSCCPPHIYLSTKVTSPMIHLSCFLQTWLHLPIILPKSGSTYQSLYLPSMMPIFPQFSIFIQVLTQNDNYPFASIDAARPKVLAAVCFALNSSLCSHFSILSSRFLFLKPSYSPRYVKIKLPWISVTFTSAKSPFTSNYVLWWIIYWELHTKAQITPICNVYINMHFRQQSMKRHQH